MTWLNAVADLRAALGQPTTSAAIIDRMIGATDSLDLLGELRADGVRAPVIIVSSLSSVDDRIRGLKNGGDDYLTKPFAMGELIARVAALIRRSAPNPGSILAAGSLRVDLISRRVKCGEREIDLLPREYALLAFLMRHAGQVVTRCMLLEEVWHYRSTTHTNVIDVHVSNLRRKIEIDGGPQLIKNVRGVGFRLEAGDALP